MTVARLRYTISDGVNFQIPGLFIDDTSHAIAVTNAISTLSTAQINSLRATVGTGLAPTPVSGTPNCLRGVVLIMSTAIGGTARLVIPSPDPAIFTGDGETVALSYATVAALNTVLISHATTRGGHSITGIVRGYITGLPVIPISRYR
jgi:hypothetical protein